MWYLINLLLNIEKKILRYLWHLLVLIKFIKDKFMGLLDLEYFDDLFSLHFRYKISVNDM